jgi:hypothetical protein
MYMGCLVTYNFMVTLFILIIIKRSNWLETRLLDLIQGRYVVKGEDVYES